MNINQKKMTSFALVSFVLVGVLVTCSIASIIYALFVNPAAAGLSWKFDLLLDMPVRLGTSAILVIVALILLSFYKIGRPFTVANVKRLKSVAVIMILIEPLQYALNIALNHFRPLIDDGLKITYVIFYGGVWFAIGLAVLCMSQMFQYGMLLQSENDETL